MKLKKHKPKNLEKEQRILRRFVYVYCSKRHGKPWKNLCGDCHQLLAYAEERLEKCPLEPKPKCKDCEIHCYDQERRKQIREVMKYSGIHYAKRGRIDWLVRYFMK